MLEILLPLRAFLIHPGAVLIFLGRAHVIECPDMIQKRREQFRVPRQLQRQNAGAVDLGIRAINRVVIDEDETVQPKIEFFRERSDVFRFALPIDAPRNQVLAFQEHIGSLVEDVQRILFIVLAAQTEQHAGVHLTDHEFLQSAVRCSHFDSQGTVLTAYPFPERVVAVQHDHFVWDRFSG